VEISDNEVGVKLTRVGRVPADEDDWADEVLVKLFDELLVVEAYIELSGVGFFLEKGRIGRQ
jgi:hypothetical protein